MENNENTSLNNLTDDEVIDLFIDGIMEEKGVNAPTDEIKQDIHKDLKNQLLVEIDRSLVAELPEEKLEELSSKASSGSELDPETIANAIKEANLDVAEITGVTMQRFRELYLGHKTNETTEA